ncbi:MAG: TldD/PmbA family protein [Candidatus Scalindua sp. AMX11]|nr:MAG: TldD/PmbA family protein [Candidatus Scalindua sp.]NOG85331.1 TldD/PmbA family protein [Planctomycetota bacterium]RZV81454.1 MAG: TldD/PmbA family protein [Candidatus Scalindua sp. SCAELEC01]TDE65472.1 MAG: TldD/PmbA family protein [Candidatus Scalindua sp. AMX11]GJQ59398.1 MAG: peptidase C69 [Candidatus Scalindua sp.]
MKPNSKIIDTLKSTVSEIVQKQAKSLRESSYFDLRLGIGEFKSARSENGTSKEALDDYEASFGIRVIAGEISSWGFYGQSLGRKDLKPGELERLLLSGIDTAYGRAKANAKRKSEFKKIANALSEVRLAKIKVCQETIPAEFEIDPRGIPLQKILKTSMNASKQMKALDPSVQFASTTIKTAITRELFCSSEGAVIDQSLPVTQGVVYLSAQQGEASPEVGYDYVGDVRGWEVIEGKNCYNSNFLDFALERTRDTVDLAGAEFLKTTEEEVVVVTNPHYNTLLVHEIVGHPTEADRVLKMETAYAGRTWLFESQERNEIGKRIGSPLVNAFSDPTRRGYGYYTYDAEGTPAKAITVIKNGVLKTFLNGRETAAILGHEPNGSMRATAPSMVPLVRMTNTIFGPGRKNPKNIIKEVKDGYYIHNYRTPSISESREHFRISAQKVYKIENGKLVKLYRGGGIMANSKDFLMSVDAVGNDFKMFPIPTCGKGQPMQIMRVGNGGPTLRSKARLTGC